MWENIWNYILFGSISNWYKSKQEIQVEKNVTLSIIKWGLFFEILFQWEKEKDCYLHQFSVLPYWPIFQDCIFDSGELKECTGWVEEGFQPPVM